MKEDVSVFARSQGDSPLKYCVWEITLACDLGCRHCGSRAGKKRPNELSTDECLDVVRQLADMGVQEVTLIGGEAYLRDDWHIIARALSDRGVAVGITTGGRGFDAERIAKALDAGIEGISVSIDGLRGTHNAQRGPKDSFDKAVEAARRIGETSMQLGINTQINRLSMVEMPALADLVVELGAEGWQLQLTVPMGRAADRPELLLQPHDLLELFPLLVYIKREKLTPNDVAVFPGNNIGYFSEYEELLRYGGREGTHWGGCAAGEGCMGIEADGAIKGCPSLPTDRYTGGNSRDTPIAELMANASPITFIKERTREDLWGFCKSCYYADVCKAGCTWTSQVLMGKAGNNPYCIHRARTYEDQGKWEVLRRVEAAPGDPFDHGRFETTLIDAPVAGQEDATILGRPLRELLALDPHGDGAWTDTQPDAPVTMQRRLRVI